MIVAVFDNNLYKLRYVHINKVTLHEYMLLIIIHISGKYMR